MAVAWKFGCPQQWTQKPKTATLRSEVEAGAPKVRGRFTKSYLEASATWVFETWGEVALFEEFFKTDLSNGALPFTMVNPLTGASLTVRFKEPPEVAADVNSKPTARVSGSLEEVLT